MYVVYAYIHIYTCISLETDLIFSRGSSGLEVRESTIESCSSSGALLGFGFVRDRGVDGKGTMDGPTICLGAEELYMRRVCKRIPVGVGVGGLCFVPSFEGGTKKTPALRCAQDVQEYIYIYTCIFIFG